MRIEEKIEKYLVKESFMDTVNKIGHKFVYTFMKGAVMKKFEEAVNWGNLQAAEEILINMAEKDNKKLSQKDINKIIDIKIEELKKKQGGKLKINQ